MNILVASSECAPFAKTGGLADSVAALALNLLEVGNDVKVVLPFYGQIKSASYPVTRILDSMCVRMGTGEEWCSVWLHRTPQGLPVYLIEHELYFARAGLYHDDRYNDFLDNPKRFGFFSRAVLQFCLDTRFCPDIVQVNDWQTALIPVYLKTWFHTDQILGQCASVLTIHNISYQGAYSIKDFGWLGFGRELYVPDIFEDHGKMNFLKAGIHFADAVNTVSPTHAQETIVPFGGFGLAPYLKNRGELYWGILNGVDYSVWSPDVDPLIPANYTSQNLAGKKKCKKHLQDLFHLDENPTVAIIGLIGRFDHQKGHTLIREILESLMKNMAIQFVVLGKGAPDLEYYYGTIPGRYPGRIGSYIGFSDKMAHCIEAGSDFFLMPSLFEPCGLNQMYSLRYGTLPIVRSVGGLNDSVDNYDERTGEGTGFKFNDFKADALYNTIGWAVSTYYDRPAHFKKMIVSAMEKDFGWVQSTKRYLELFTRAIQAREKR